MKPGIYAEISNQEYHSGPGVSKSLLDLVARSPLHAHYAMTAANDRQPTPAQEFGTAFHALLLEPEAFHAEYALPFDTPAGALATVDDLKAALDAAGVPFKSTMKKPQLAELVREHIPSAVILDDAKAAYLAENDGRHIIASDVWETLHTMRDAVMAHPAARALLTGAPGKTEQSVYWIDEKTGELCRCRPDFWRNDGIIVDLKTAEDASPEGFSRSMANYRYYVQHPYYMDGINAMIAQTGADVEPIRAFAFLVVEKKPPHAVAVYVLDAASVELGRLEYQRDLATFHQCQETGNWPGYGEKIQSISLPRWAFGDAANLLDAA